MAQERVIGTPWLREKHGIQAMSDKSEIEAIRAVAYAVDAYANSVDDVRTLLSHVDALEARVATLERVLVRHGDFHASAISLVRDMRLALLRGDYLMKQKMDVRSDVWLKEVDGPRLASQSQEPK